MASAPDSTSVLPGKSSRTIAYAANMARTTASRVAISAMPIELRSAALNWSSLKMFAVVVERRVRPARNLPSVSLSAGFSDSDTIQATGTSA